jgi:high-affinity iron transporter
MLSAFLVSLREGVEAALIVGLCLAYLRKIDRRDLERPVWYAVAASLLASLVAAWLLGHFSLNEDSVEGFLMLVAAVLLVGMIIWMRRVARSLRGEIEAQVGRFARRDRLPALGLFLFVFAMVLREGAETVILVGAVALNAHGLPIILGTVLGLALAVALGVFFFKGTLPIRLHRFFEATSIMLIVVAVQLTLTGVHELSESLVIPSGPWMMRLLGPIVRNDIVFFVILLGVAVWLVARELLHRRHGVARSGLSEAEELGRQRQQARELRWMTATAATALIIVVALTAEHVYARTEVPLPYATPVRAASDAVRIPLAEVNDGELHHLRFSQGTTTIRFLAIRMPDGHMFAGLEACTICGAHGYYRDAENVICRNCAAAIPIIALETMGGCNPVPLHAHVEGAELVIPVSHLLDGAHFFSAR